MCTDTSTFTCIHAHVHACGCYSNREICEVRLQWSGCGKVILNHEAREFAHLVSRGREKNVETDGEGNQLGDGDTHCGAGMAEREKEVEIRG